MNKAEFVDKLAEKGKITKKQATEAIELVFSIIGEALVACTPLEREANEKRQHRFRFTRSQVPV